MKSAPIMNCYIHWPLMHTQNNLNVHICTNMKEITIDHLDMTHIKNIECFDISENHI